jgi:hypothetical protein
MRQQEVQEKRTAETHALNMDISRQQKVQEAMQTELMQAEQARKVAEAKQKDEEFKAVSAPRSPHDFFSNARGVLGSEQVEQLYPVLATEGVIKADPATGLPAISKMAFGSWMKREPEKAAQFYTSLYNAAEGTQKQLEDQIKTVQLKNPEDKTLPGLQKQLENTLAYKDSIWSQTAKITQERDKKLAELNDKIKLEEEKAAARAAFKEDAIDQKVFVDPKGNTVLVNMKDPNAQKIIEARGLKSQAEQLTTIRVDGAGNNRAENKQKSGKLLPTKLVSDLGDIEDKVSRLGSLAETFNPSFAGKIITGGLNTKLKELSGTDSPQVNWWKEYKELDAMRRNKIFGASLTGNEKKSWDAITITERTDPKIVQKVIAQQGDIAQKAWGRMKVRFAKSGYDMSAFGEQDDTESSPNTAKKTTGAGSPAKTSANRKQGKDGKWYVNDGQGWRPE